MRSVVLLLVLHSAAALQLGLAAPRCAASHTRTADLRMGMFDGLKGAFANDDSLGEKKSAGDR